MTNDLSFQIIALDRASATFVQVADQLDRLAGRLDKLDGKNVNVNVDVKTDDSTAGLNVLDTRFQQMAAGIIAASPLAGVAILGGIGAGFIGAAVLAQKSNADIQTTYKGLWDNVVDTTKSATNSLVPAIVNAGKSVNAEFITLAPTISAAFSSAGPDIAATARAVDNFAHNSVPGVSQAMQQSLPVFQGIATASGTVGQAVGDMAASVGQHAQEYGTVMTSVGSITSSALGGATVIVNDLGAAWAQNAPTINTAVDGVTTGIGGLANGVLPVLSFALGTAAGAIKDITGILGPLAPVIGATAAAAGLLWVGFKISSAVTSGIKSVGTSVADMGAALEKNAEKSAAYIAGMEGVAVESSVAASSVKAAGIAASTSATGFGLAATAAAGWLGPALIIGTTLLGLFSGSEDKASASAADLSGGLGSVTSALQNSNGAIDAAVVRALQADPAFKTAADATKQFGLSQTDLINEVTQGGPALDQLKTRLQGIIDASHVKVATGRSGLVDTGELTDAGKAAQTALGALNNLSTGYAASQQAAATAATALKDHADALVSSSEGQAAAARVAKALGLSLGDVRNGFQAVAASSTEANGSIAEITASFVKNATASGQAAVAIADHFKSADAAVVTAHQGVTDATQNYQKSLVSIGDAQHSYAQAAQGIADAQYAVGTAERGVQDAMAGVVTARAAYATAQKTELTNELALNKAREQAVEDLKSLHLQLADQGTSEESANVRLFDSTQSAAGLGVTPGNAAGIAGTKVTAANEAQVKAAIDLVSAQNAVNDTMNTGANLRVQVAAADKAGVNGAAGVVSAQTALVSSQQAVNTAYLAIGKAQQGVVDADRALAKAHQGVTDAAYAEQKAHLAVVDAQNASSKSAAALQKAKIDLTAAIAADSRTFDINTKAGQENLTLLQTLWTAIQTEGGPKQDQYNKLVDATTTAFGGSRQAAIDYLKSINDIPQDFKYSVTAVAQMDMTPIQKWSDGYFKGGFRSLGGPVGMADGGPVKGGSGPRADDVPLWASGGEYMQPAHVVDHYGVGFMNAVRDRKIPKYADGGQIIAGNFLGAVAGAQYESVINTAGVMGFPHPPPLPVYVAPAPSSVGGFTGGGGPNGVIPTGQHLALIDAALAADGIAKADWARWEAGMNVLIERESSWNANIVNTWDSNAKAGHPSGGLTQTIIGTFESNRNHSLPDNMFDPVANIAASINYIRHTYGDISRVQQANPNLPKKGYDNGGALEPGWSSVYNGTGKPENVRTAGAEDALMTAVKELTAAVANQQGGGMMTAKLFAHDGTFMGMVSGQVKQTVTGITRQFGPLT